MQQTKLNPITIARLQKLRAEYLRQLKQAQERVSDASWSHRYLQGEINVLEEAHDYLGECAVEAK